MPPAARAATTTAAAGTSIFGNPRRLVSGSATAGAPTEERKTSVEGKLGAEPVAAMRAELDTVPEDAPSVLDGGGGSGTTATEPEAAAATRPVSVSRLRRNNSERMSEACW